MAKAVKEKPAKGASNIFHSIMKASMQPKKGSESKGAREWYDYEHPTTRRIYIIRYFYETGDEQRKCTLSLQSNNPKERDEIEIASFNYATKKHVDVDEAIRLRAIDHGNMQPPDFIK